jgi:peroxiredoxin
MKKYLKCAFFIVIAILFFRSFIFAGDLAAAPDFKLDDLEKNTITLSSYKDKKPVLVIFWTTWCPFCRTQLKILNKKYTDLVADNLEILAINVGEPYLKVESFAKSYDLLYSVLLDPDSQAARSFRILGVPTYFLINKSGYVVFQDSYFPEEEYKGLLAK